MFRLVLASGVIAAAVLGQTIFRVPSSCSLADGHDHAAMAAIDCFPDATNTGVPAGTSLSAYTGSNPITSNGTTIDAKIFDGADCPLTIQATGVTITNSEFNCTGAAISIDDAAEWSEASNGTAYLLTVKDSYISCGETSATGVEESFVRLIRVHMELCENGLSINQKMSLEDSYVHNLASVGGDPHEDGSQHSCGHWEGGGGGGCVAGYEPGALNINYLHNTLLGRTNDDASNATSAIIMNKEGTLDENVLAQYNRFGGGAYTIYCNRFDAGTPDSTGINVQIKDNWFWSATYPPAADESYECSDEADVSGNKLYPSGTPLTLARLDLGRPIYNLLNAFQVWRMPWMRVRF
jgi:hypothetical protein